MNTDLLTLVSKLREAKSLEDMEQVKAMGESFLRKEKRYAILTLLTVYEEFGDSEILDSLKNLTAYLEEGLKKEDRQ